MSSIETLTLPQPGGLPYGNATHCVVLQPGHVSVVDNASRRLAWNRSFGHAQQLPEARLSRTAIALCDGESTLVCSLRDGQPLLTSNAAGIYWLDESRLVGLIEAGDELRLAGIAMDGAVEFALDEEHSDIQALLVDESRIFAATGTLCYAFDMDRGAMAWELPIAALAEGALETNVRRWKQTAAGRAPIAQFFVTPLCVCNGALICGTNTGVVFALDAGSGAVRWVSDDLYLDSDTPLGISQACADEGRVYAVNYLPSWGKDVFCFGFDARTGRLRLRSDRPVTPEGSQGIQALDHYLVGANRNHFSVFDMNTEQFVLDRRVDGVEQPFNRWTLAGRTLVGLAGRELVFCALDLPSAPGDEA